MTDDDKPPLSDVWEIDWPEGMEAESRIDSIVLLTPQPRTARYVADKSDVSVGTARDRMMTLAARDELTVVGVNEDGERLYFPVSRLMGR
jgi:hypothetical protein